MMCEHGISRTEPCPACGNRYPQMAATPHVLLAIALALLMVLAVLGIAGALGGR
jgi:hypothetical protein